MLRLDDIRRGLLETPGIAGVDEAGRGPLAGPVVAAAVVLPDRFDIRGLNDSKQLTAEQRRVQFELIMDRAHVAYALVGPEEIDELNILKATMLAMKKSIDRISAHAKECFIDGDRVPEDLAIVAHPVVKGDANYASVAAASIIAKHVRDDIMIQYATQYPQYGFHKHMGYPTAEHIEALRVHGPCPIHRKTFSRVRELVEQPCLSLDA